LRRLRAYCLDQSHRRLSSLTNGEFRFIDRKGKTKDILLTIGSIADTQRSVASLLNITHRKQVEVELQKAHDELEHCIKERTADLEKANKQLQHEVKERVATEQQKEELINKLQIALSEIKKLSGLLPICASCKIIRDDRGYWNQIETYISSHSEAVFSHSLCPECMDKLYGDEDWYKKYK
jgi:hypothetical protein